VMPSNRVKLFPMNIDNAVSEFRRFNVVLSDLTQYLLDQIQDSSPAEIPAAAQFA